MSHLEILNLGRNKLNGQLSDMFGKLTKLKELDLSYNSLTGNLPQSFGKLSSLKKLYLQNNQLTGQINVLIYTPIEELNIENNCFSGWIPNDLKGLEETPGRLDHLRFLLLVHTVIEGQAKRVAPPVSKSPSIGFKSLSGRLQSFARRSTSVKATAYALEDLQVATANFALARLHEQGTIGRVYRAKYSDGKVLAVKKNDSTLFQGLPPQEFSDIVLRDLDALSQIVDLALRGLYPPKLVSRFAGIVALCVQREPEFRPPMSEVVQQLVWLVQSSDANMREAFGLGASRHSSAMSSRREDLAASRRLTYF
ncbi:unnamed protein product [Malus baccata var. baccata]